MEAYRSRFPSRCLGGSAVDLGRHCAEGGVRILRSGSPDPIIATTHPCSGRMTATVLTVKQHALRRGDVLESLQESWRCDTWQQGNTLPRPDGDRAAREIQRHVEDGSTVCASTVCAW